MEDLGFETSSLGLPQVKIVCGPIVRRIHADYDDEILSEEQWKWLTSRINRNGPLILAGGVPWLQLPCADVWLLRGTRPNIPLIKKFEEMSQENTDIFEFYRRDSGTDQWMDTEVKKNNPEFCPSPISGGTIQDMRRSYEQNLKATKKCDLSLDPADVMRLFLPDALPAFDRNGEKMKWTHLNNIGILKVWRDGKSVKMSWFGPRQRRERLFESWNRSRPR